MPEGGPRFEQRFEGYRSPESPERQLRNVARTEFQRIHWESEDPLAIAISEIVLEKIRIKDLVEDIYRHADDVSIYQDLKKLGIFIVREVKSKHDFQDNQKRLDLQEGDVFLDIHVPPLSEEAKTLPKVNDSYRLIAEYIQHHNLQPKYIIGVTYERLAKASRRYGFTVAEPNLPDEITQGIENVYRNLNEKGISGKPMGKILVCFQTTEDFMDRFSPIEQ